MAETPGGKGMARDKIAASLRLMAQQFEAGEVVVFSVSWVNQEAIPTTLCWPGEHDLDRLALLGAMDLAHDVLVGSFGDPIPHKRTFSVVTPEDPDA